MCDRDVLRPMSRYTIVARTLHLCVHGLHAYTDAMSHYAQEPSSHSARAHTHGIYYIQYAAAPSPFFPCSRVNYTRFQRDVY